MSVFKTKNRPKIDVKDIKESDILPDSNASPYDSLQSNKGSIRNIYLERASGDKTMQSADDPTRKYNAPPWLQENAQTMGDERREIEGRVSEVEYSGRGGRRRKERNASGLSRDDSHSEFGGMNVFARMKGRKQQKEAMRSRHRRPSRTILAAKLYR
ncbi:hypothetical protein KC614_00725 [candidate division WWE3 bacterium]|uniref:Uncharacterized protein n=1 Tax=candidate division WWE3 bacterium TaxID=2053526 RepID=A0A955LJS9_UNCKA|nr:hypothetical protein [candidate division WWE3 bacterium]